MPPRAGRPSVTYKKTPIFAPTAGARSSISPKFCVLIENVGTILKTKRCQSFFDPTHSFSCRGENADFWSLTHWVNLIPAGCHGNLPVTRNKSIVPCWTMHTGRIYCQSTEKAVNYAVNNSHAEYFQQTLRPIVYAISTAILRILWRHLETDIRNV